MSNIKLLILETFHNIVQEIRREATELEATATAIETACRNNNFDRAAREAMDYHQFTELEWQILVAITEGTDNG